VITAPLLHLTRAAGESVLTLTEGVSEAELLRSRLTRTEAQRQLQRMADALGDAPDALRHLMPEIDWAAWRATRLALPSAGEQQDEALCFGVRSLVPATLSWLRVYQLSHPELFTTWH
jgi:hypothetical protein